MYGVYLLKTIEDSCLCFLTGFTSFGVLLRFPPLITSLSLCAVFGGISSSIDGVFIEEFHSPVFLDLVNSSNISISSIVTFLPLGYSADAV